METQKPTKILRYTTNVYYKSATGGRIMELRNQAIKKYISYEDPVSIRPLAPHILASGQTGSGKSSSGELVLGAKFLHHNFTEGQTPLKCHDIYDDGRCENALYCFAEDDQYLLELIALRTQGRMKATAFDQDYYVICGNYLRYFNTLPSNFKVVSFDANSVSGDDLFLLLGKTESAKAVIASILIENPNVGLFDIYNALRNGHIEDINVATRKMMIYTLRNWLYSGMFADGCEKINFSEICNNPKLITGYSTMLLEPEYKPIARGLIYKNIVKFKLMNQSAPTQFFYHREAAYDLGSGADQNKKLVQKQVDFIIRQGRDLGLLWLADTQRGSDLGEDILANIGLNIQLRSSIFEAEKMMRYAGGIPRTYLEKAPKLEVGTGFLLAGGSWEYPFMFPPALNRHKRPRTNAMKYIGERVGFVTYDVEKILTFEPNSTLVSSNYGRTKLTESTTKSKKKSQKMPKASEEELKQEAPDLWE